MKGLLMKDFYTLLKQTKLFFLVIIVFALMPNFSFTAFAVVYSAMLPVTALAYDERSGWDRLAAMMPYRIEDLVFEKYLLGYLAVGSSGVLCFIVRFVYHLIGGGGWGAEVKLQILLYLCVATVLLSINLPFMFKIGVEKGRIAFLVLTVIFVLSVSAVGEELVSLLGTMRISMLVPIIILVTAIINVLSIMLSTRFYRNKRR